MQSLHNLLHQSYGSVHHRWTLPLLPHNETPMTKRYSIVNDPIFYGTVVFFALLTTGLPAIIGQPLFMPIAQTLALFVFMTMTLRQRLIRQTLIVVGLWLVTQFLVLLVAMILLEERVQLAISDGFIYGMSYIDWFYGVSGAVRPDSFVARPIGRTLELLGITVGSIATAGFVGTWFLVRTLNLAAFNTGVLVVVAENTPALIGALPLWALLRIGGYAGLVILLAEPLLTNNWNPLFYLRERRRLLIISAGLLIVGLLLELILPNLWRTILR